MKYFWLIMAFGVLVACDSDDESANERDFLKTFDGVRSESFGVTYYFSDSTRVTAELIAEHILEMELPEPSKEVVHIVDRGLRMNFLNARGRPHSYVESDSGRFDLKERKGALFGNVHLRNSEGETLDTEVLYWNQKKDSIFTDSKVRIETEDKIIIGKRGFRSNTEFTSYIIYGIEGEIEAEDR